MGKGLKDKDPKYQVHKKYYKDVVPSCADVLILENVPEYDMQAVVAHELGPSWSCLAMVIDPRCFGFGTSRARHYALCWRRDRIKLDVNFPLMKTVEALKARPMMVAKDYFWRKLPQPTLTPSVAFW